MKTTVLAAFAVASVAMAGTARADYVAPWIEWEQRQNADQRLTAFGPDLMGDQIDPNTGALVFEHADVVLPGNSKLEVALRRRLSQGFLYDEGVNAEFGNWEYLVPRIVAITRSAGWTGARCNNNFNTSFPYIPRVNSYPVQYLYNAEYSNGVKLEVPGFGSQHVLELPQGPQWPAGTKYTTSENWFLTCIAAQNGGEGFYAYGPNGTRYRFDRYIHLPFRPLGVMLAAKSLGTPRSKAILAATEVTDVNGNWVRYDYDGWGRLTRIHANDGREIELVYFGTSRLVSQVRANPNGAVRTWNYAYRQAYGAKPSWEGGTGFNIQVLSSVTLPDGRAWTFDLDGMFAEPTPGECWTYARQLQITHPQGALATFWLAEARHRQGLNVMMEKIWDCPATEPSPPPSPWSEWVTAQVDTMSVVSKKIEGPGLGEATWSFAYEWDEGAPGSSAGDPTNTTTVTQPDGTQIVYHHRWQEGPLGGLIVRKEIRQSAQSPIIEEISHSYFRESPVGYTFAEFGSYSTSAFAKIRPADTVIARNGDTYATSHVYDGNFHSPTYSFGLPVQTTESSSTAPGVSRVTNTAFAHNLTQWVIGLPSAIYRNGKLFDSWTYDGLGRIATRSRFGGVKETYTYSSTPGQEGTIATFQDALYNTYTLSNWRRGRPQWIQRPDGSVFSRVLDDNGWVTSETDGRGHTTGFAYNAMGWLTYVDRPSYFSDTITTYGNSGGPTIATATRGTRRTTVNYDALLRPLLAETSATDASVAPIYERSTFDVFGRQTFKSWPSASSAAPHGVTTSYDVLSRVTGTAENVWPFVSTSTEYLGGGVTRLTDAVGAQTLTTNRAFGTPTRFEAVQVIDAMGGVTAMARDVYGNIMQLTQAGTQNGYSASVTRHFWYDDDLRLCRHRAPEFGDELFAYDAMDRVRFSSRGEPGGLGCAFPSPGIRTELSYDSRGRVTHTDFPTGTPDIAVSYDANGNRTSVSRGGADWTYAYNALDLLTQERLVIDGRAYQFDFGWNAAGDLTSRSRAGGPSVTFAVDAFGRQTGVSANGSAYVYGGAHHPNGVLASANLGNGHVFWQTLDARQQPMDLYTGPAGGPAVVWLAHSYDARGKLTSAWDLVNANEGRSFGYDAKGRLLTANGPWGTGSFVYDALDNLRRQTLGGRDIYVVYDAATNRVSVAYDAGSYRPYDYDARGNATTVGPLALTYDFANQPVAVSGGAGAAYLYDGHLKRVRSVADGKTTYSVYSALGGSVILRDEVTDGRVTDYLAAGPVSVRLVNGVPQYTYADRLGSPLAGVNAAGVLLWRESYSPFGEARIRPAGNQNDTGYTGHVQDAATGLAYMQARYYDPVIGRFLATDPVGYLDQFNLYAYVANDPINNTDPTGQLADAVIDIGFIIGDLVDIASNGLSAANGASLAGNLLGLAVPGATGVGLAARGAVEGAQAANRAADGASAAERAKAIQVAAGDARQGRTTTAVVETKEGTRVVASSEPRLRSDQQAALVRGEVAAKGAGHAEVTAVNAAKSMGLTPTGVAASRPICADCAEFLRKEGVEPLTPLKDEVK